MAKKHSSTIGIVEEEKICTYYKDGGGCILNPTHGTSGWHEGQVHIFDAKWSRTMRWLTLREYQETKERETRKIDHRLHDAYYFTARAESAQAKSWGQRIC